MKDITLRERYRGAMVGVLCGDALGAPYETWKSADIWADIGSRGGLVLFDYPNPWKKENPNTFPKGRPTDDSDHTAALAESLIANRGLDEEDLFNRLRHVVFDHVSPLWDGRAVGAGTTTRDMLRPQTWAESKALGSDGAYPSNGSLMRSVPLALYFGSYAKVNSDIVRVMSAITHRHPVAQECCDAYINILTGILQQQTGRRILTSMYWAQDSTLRAVLENPFIEPRDPEKWPGRGDAVLTLHVALWALVGTLSFEQGISKAVTFGGDTDTYGAVAGGLLGARYGIQAIPEEWQRDLIGRDKMIDLADQLFDIAHS